MALVVVIFGVDFTGPHILVVEWGLRGKEMVDLVCKVRTCEFPLVVSFALLGMVS
jgi:hypothetical protein